MPDETQAFIARIPRVLVSDGASGGFAGKVECADYEVRFDPDLSLSSIETQIGAKRLLVPKWADPHVHLDKCHTIDRMGAVGGDLGVAIAAQAADRETWTQTDVRERMSRGLEECIESGCGAIRTHIDWHLGIKPPMAWHIAAELSQHHRDRIVVQTAALTDIELLADRENARLVASHVAETDGVLGSFVLGQGKREDGIRNAFTMAEAFGLALDFHVDESLDPDLDGVEMIADVALETGFQGPVLCGHACSLRSKSQDARNRIADKLAEAGVAIAALPFTNAYLQGRTDGTPDRRGLTCVHELRTRGVLVTIGADNVRDAFCPTGVHDPLRNLALMALLTHLDPPFSGHLPLIAGNSRQAMGLDPITVDGATVDDVMVFEAASLSELFSRCPKPKSLSHANLETSDV